MNALVLALFATLAVASAAPSWGLGAGWGGSLAHGAVLAGPVAHGAAVVGPQAPGAAVIGPVQGPSAIVGPRAGPSAVVGPVNHGALLTPAIAAPSVIAAPALGVVGEWGNGGWGNGWGNGWGHGGHW